MICWPISILHCDMGTPNFEKKTPQPLYCNHDWYLLALNEYYQQTRRQEIIAKWTEEEFESNVVKNLSERFGDKLNDQTLSVLGVGSGDGYQETLQLKKLKTKFSRISATVIEPNTKQICKYQITVRQNSSDITGIKHKWHNQTFQEFMTSIEAEQKYHFITIVHAMYYMGEVEEAVKTFYELLEPGGKILIMLVTDSGMALLAKTFPQLAVEEQTPTATTESNEAKTNCLITSTDVKSVLSKYQMAYTQSSYTLSADLTTCFTQDEMTPATKLVLDFITMTVKFQESVSDKTFNEVMDFIKRNTRVQKSDQGGDKYYFDTACDILVISK
ncbi:histamine N-methyltransferase A-like [Amphiura filiformis]|uniref:histamine N-methyltransferase A-like n=1 Tax=Amphiura filiformis TaxID=82378 RepID=UPI003B22244E